MSENEIVKNEDDEISLIDLFAVMLRYRKLIIFGTLIVTVLAGLYLYVLPKFKKVPVESVTVTYTVKVKTLPSTVLNSLPGYYSTAECFKTYIERPQTLGPLFISSDVFEECNGKSITQVYSAIGNLITNKTYEVKPSKIGGAYDVSFVVPASKIDSTGILITNIVNSIEKQMEDTYIPLLDDLKVLSQNSAKVMTFLKASPDSTEKDINYMQDMIILGTQVDKFYSTYVSFLEINESPYISYNSGSQKRGLKFLIIACFVALFIFIFIAFLLNAIENIKADPEASKTISDAWKSGKVSKK